MNPGQKNVERIDGGSLPFAVRKPQLQTRLEDWPIRHINPLHTLKKNFWANVTDFFLKKEN